MFLSLFALSAIAVAAPAPFSPGCDQSGAVPDDRFAELVHELSVESNSITRQEDFDEFVDSGLNRGFTGNQTVTLLDLFDNEITKQEILEKASPFLLGITCDQLAVILNRFKNSISREEILDSTLNLVTDLRYNNETIVNCFTNSITRDEVREKIEKAKPRSCVWGDVTGTKRPYFIVDRSYSMTTQFRGPDGTTTRLQFVAKNLAQVINENLNSKQEFNVVSFSGSANAWEPGVVPYTPQNAQAATDFVYKIQADGGGTYMLTGLKAAFADKKCSGVFFLSDGEATDSTSDILSTAQSWSKATGYAVNTISFQLGGSYSQAAADFMLKLANTTGGTFRALGGSSSRK